MAFLCWFCTDEMSFCKGSGLLSFDLIFVVFGKRRSPGVHSFWGRGVCRARWEQSIDWARNGQVWRRIDSGLHLLGTACRGRSLSHGDGAEGQGVCGRKRMGLLAIDPARLGLLQDGCNGGVMRCAKAITVMAGTRGFSGAGRNHVGRRLLRSVFGPKVNIKRSLLLGIASIASIARRLFVLDIGLHKVARGRWPPYGEHARSDRGAVLNGLIANTQWRG